MDITSPGIASLVLYLHLACVGLGSEVVLKRLREMANIA